MDMLEPPGSWYPRLDLGARLQGHFVSVECLAPALDSGTVDLSSSPPLLILTVSTYLVLTGWQALGHRLYGL